MRQVLADTGPLYALVDPDDRLHARARREAEALASTKLVPVVATPVLAEAHNLVLQRLGGSAALGWLRDVTTGAGLVNPKTEDFLAAAARLRRYDDQPISLTDAVLAELSARLGMPVWTFDHHFDLLRAAVWRS